MGTLFLLVAEASAVHSELAEGASEGGFGLNLDIFETNLINLVILIGVLVYFGRGFLTKTLTERRINIETEISEADASAKKAAASLSEAQQNLTQAQAEAQRIRQAATVSAESAREAILARAKQDVERLRETANADLNTETERAIAQLRQRVAAMALEKVESQLRGGVDSNVQQQLIQSSIATIGES
jgi:F-type H+-transporting ATPase subunit b